MQIDAALCARNKKSGRQILTVHTVNIRRPLSLVLVEWPPVVKNRIAD